MTTALLGQMQQVFSRPAVYCSDALLMVASLAGCCITVDPAANADMAMIAKSII